MKCPNCGGTMVPLGDGSYECDSCGTVQKPVAQEKLKDTELLKLAAGELANAEFDDAYLIFENYLRKHPSDAAARWNLLLCRYGIQYETETVRGQTVSKPTLHRMQQLHILEDPDFLQLLQDAPAGKREEYRKEAEEIGYIQERFRGLILTEEPYDVFISFKNEEKPGVLTKDREIAYRIFTRLTELKLRVFFSPYSLNEVSGDDYEPHIYAALNSAKVMVLVGTTQAHLAAPWVRNEWSRYLSLMEKDRSLTLIPVLQGMTAAQLPPQLPARNIAEFKGEQTLGELVAAILGLTGKGTIVDGGDTERIVSERREAMRAALAAGDFDRVRMEAGELQTMLEEDSATPEESPAYAESFFYLLMAQYKVKRQRGLVDLDDAWEQSGHYKRALRFGDDALKKTLKRLAWQHADRMEEDRRQTQRAAETQQRERDEAEAMQQVHKLMEERRYERAAEILNTRAYNKAETTKLLTICSYGAELQQRVSPGFYMDELKRRNGKLYERAGRQAASLQRMEERSQLHTDNESANLFILEFIAVFLAVIGSGYSYSWLALITAILLMISIASWGLRMLHGGILIIGTLIFMVIGVIAAFADASSCQSVFAFLFSIGLILMFFSLLAIYRIYQLKKAREKFYRLHGEIAAMEQEIWSELVERYLPYVGAAVLAEYKPNEITMDSFLRG